MDQKEPDHLTTPALQDWLRRTQTPLDLVALMTIWLTILPFTRATDTSGFTFWVAGRLLLSLLYGIDITVRARLSAAPRRYVLSHPIALLAVVVPVRADPLQHPAAERRCSARGRSGTSCSWR